MSAWLQAAKTVFTVSHAVRSELISFAPRLSHKYATVLLATDIPASRFDQIAAQADQRTGKTVFYYPATVSTHKNHATLLRAAVLLAKRGLDFELVLTGSGTEKLTSTAQLTGCQEDIRRILISEDASLGSRVRPLGYISRDELAEEFARADCMVLPSLFEGFGLPLTEGLGWGKQIICSNIASYAEQIAHYQAGDWVHVFNPHAADELADHMQRVIKSPRPHGATSGEIARRVRQWTWADAARAYARALQ